MRTIFFILFGIMLVLLIFLVDWQEKISELANKDNVKAIRDMLGPQATSIDSAKSDSSANWNMDEMWMGEPSLSDESAQNSPLKSISLESRELQPQRRGGGVNPPKSASEKFQDVSEEPYLTESRRLLQRIRQNYKKIVSAPRADTQDPNRP